MLLLRALGVVAAVRIALLVLPFRVVYSLVQSRATFHSHRVVMTPGAVAWSVARSASVVPGANCLVQALAASILLARHGHIGAVRLGARRAGQRMQAHAWVEHEGRVVVGDRDDLPTFGVLVRTSGIGV